MRLLIKWATRGRKQLFWERLRNIHSTIATKDFQIIVSCDNDDKEMLGIERELKKYPKVKVFYGEPVSKIAAINRDMDKADEWDWLVNFSDDMSFTVNGWDRLMLQDIHSVWNDSLDWFAHFSDGYVHEKLPTMSIMGRDYYNRFGYIYHGSYGSVSCDAEAMFVAMMLGKHHYFSNVYFNHLHPANIRSKTDATYLRNHKFDQPDTENYFQRRARLFDVENPVVIPYDPTVRA